MYNLRVPLSQQCQWNEFYDKQEKKRKFPSFSNRIFFFFCYKKNLFSFFYLNTKRGKNNNNSENCEIERVSEGEISSERVSEGERERERVGKKL